MSLELFIAFPPLKVTTVKLFLARKSLRGGIMNNHDLDTRLQPASTDKETRPSQCRHSSLFFDKLLLDRAYFIACMR